jgi:hypothetical protein
MPEAGVGHLNPVRNAAHTRTYDAMEKQIIQEFTQESKSHSGVQNPFEFGSGSPASSRQQRRASPARASTSRRARGCCRPARSPGPGSRVRRQPLHLERQGVPLGADRLRGAARLLGLGTSPPESSSSKKETRARPDSPSSPGRRSATRRCLPLTQTFEAFRDVAFRM